MARDSLAACLNVEGNRDSSFPLLCCTVHLSNSSLPQKMSWSFPIHVFRPPESSGDRNVPGCPFSWQYNFSDSTTPAFWFYPRSSHALAWELKALGHIRAEQPRQSCSWHQGKLFAPRGKHSLSSVQSINPSLLCYKRPYCRNTNHSEMAYTMSNHLIATGHPLGMGPN